MIPEHAQIWRGMRFAMRGPDSLNMSDTKLTPGTLKRVVKLGKKYMAKLALFLLLLLVISIAGAVVPLIYRVIIDNGIGKAPPKTAHPNLILLLGLSLVILALLTAGLSLIQRWYSAVIGEGLIYDLRTEVFSHVQRLGVPFFIRTQTGSLVSRLDNDVVGAQQAFTGVLSNVIGSLLTVFITLGAMFVLSWELTLLSLLLIPLLLLLSRFVSRRLAAITREKYNLNAAMTTMMTERFNVAGAMLVKLFGRAEDENSTFGEKAKRVRDIGVSSAMYTQGFLVALTLVASLAAALVYGFGGHLVAGGVLSIGTMVALASYLNRLFAPITALSNAPLTVMSALVSFDRIFEVLDLPVQITDKLGAVDLLIKRDAGSATNLGNTTDGVSVEFDHVYFTYPKPQDVLLASLAPLEKLDDMTLPLQVLKDVTFHIKPGQMVALVGPSGAGKTTVCHLVPRLYDAEQGVVRVGGYDVRDVTLDSLHNVVGIATQDSHLFHDTIRANLAYARPAASSDELWEALSQAQLADFIRTLPDMLDTVVGDRGYRLSGGEKQRIAIARLLLKAPAVVILDEATAHLDSESELAVQAALDVALKGRTSLVIAHRLSTVRAADLILVLDGGRIVEQGRHEELLSAGGLYSDLYQIQFLNRSTSNNAFLNETERT
ncbi:MAG: ABC transporter ATP-binding protein/permease [Actinobacteria bacterium]|nr:ABC transporter ATP-binding protein/permease [Actinomycetota bacterium]MCL6104521.1 ABC transporter ATP-binding protein/permease [Actinomycetota bacterium]